jgi:hypothetical protein
MLSSRWAIVLSVLLMAAMCENDAASKQAKLEPVQKVDPVSKIDPATKFNPVTKVDPGAKVDQYQPPRNADNGPVTIDDIERWRKGMVAELASVKTSIAKIKASRNAQDSLDNMTATTDMATLETGARAAGLSTERYNFVRSTLQSATSSLSPGTLLGSSLTPDMLAQFKKSGEEQIANMSSDLPPDVVTALRPLSDGLARQNMALSVERLCAAGQCKK